MLVIFLSSTQKLFACYWSGLTRGFGADCANLKSLHLLVRQVRTQAVFSLIPGLSVSRWAEANYLVAILALFWHMLESVGSCISSRGMQFIYVATALQLTAYAWCDCLCYTGIFWSFDIR